MTTASDIIATESNQAILTEYFEGIASCSYYDGTSYQLYLDLDDNSLRIHQEASDQSWIQRDDGSLVQIHKVSGYCDIPAAERYTDGCDIMDYGYADWIDNIEAAIAAALPKPPSIDRQRDGRFNLYVPRRHNEPVDTRPYRGQFDSFFEASDYAKRNFGVSVDVKNLTLR